MPAFDLLPLDGMHQTKSSCLVGYPSKHERADEVGIDQEVVARVLLIGWCSKSCYQKGQSPWPWRNPEVVLAAKET